MIGLDSLAGTIVRNYDPVEFDLQPGLYPIGVVFGCWRDQQVIGPGHLTVLIRHPGERDFQPARADEVLRPLPPPR